MKEIFFRRISYSSLFILAITSLVIFIACQREIRSSRIKKTDPVIQARIWFHRKFDKDLTLSKEGKLIGGDKYPDWRFPKIYSLSSLEIVEVPLLEKKRHVYILKDEQITPAINVSITKLLVAKNKYGGRKEALLHIIPTKQYLDVHSDLSSISLNNVPKDFNGIIFTTSWKNDFLNGWQIKNGIIEKVLKPATTNSNTRINSFGVFVGIYCGAECDIEVDPNVDSPIPNGFVLLNFIAISAVT